MHLKDLKKKKPAELVSMAEELGVDQALAFLNSVDDINLRRRRRAIEVTTDLLGGDVRGKRIAVLGAAFKPDSDDIRDSPALDVAAMLHELGAEVRVNDPKALEKARERRPELTYLVDPFEACADVDVVLHLTEWSVYREIDPAVLGKVVRHKRILEGRHTLDSGSYVRDGWDFRALGRPHIRG